MSIGPQFLGCEPMVAVDWNPLAIGHLKANHLGTVLQLDLTHGMLHAKSIRHASILPPGTLLMGFPCQPHSQQGRQLGCADERAQVLWHGLHVAYMIQPQAVMLECTPAAGQNEEVQNVFDCFCSGYEHGFSKCGFRSPNDLAMQTQTLMGSPSPIQMEQNWYLTGSLGSSVQ